MGKRKLKKKVRKYLYILLILLIIGLYFIYQYKFNNNNLSIELVGDNIIELNLNEEYIEQGSTAKWMNKDITSDITINSNIDNTKVGEYKTIYKIKYESFEKSIERTIKVIDNIKPEIVLNGPNNIMFYRDSKFLDDGATAIDNYDGDITNNIVVTNNINSTVPGEYDVIYTVKDSSGNESSITRHVTITNEGIQKVPVINYHFFYDENTESCGEEICEKMSDFISHLNYLRDNNFKTLTMKEYVDWIYGEIDVPVNSILITIDDGAMGTGKHNGNKLIPALEEYKMHATLFLITGWWDISNYESPYLDVESHTNNLHFSGDKDCSHRSRVNCVPYNTLVDDLNTSISITNSKLAFCFPFYDATDESVRAVQEVGFKVSFVGGGSKSTRESNKYRIPRYPIQKNTSMSQFIKMVT